MTEEKNKWLHKDGERKMKLNGGWIKKNNIKGKSFMERFGGCKISRGRQAVTVEHKEKKEDDRNVKKRRKIEKTLKCGK